MNDLVLQKLEWDSNHFGINIANLDSNILDLNDIDYVIKEAAQQGIKCIYCLVDPNNLDLIHCLSDYNFRFIDIRVLFKLKILSIDINLELKLEFASSRDLATISYWVGSFHHDSRFFKDKNFDLLKVQKMYSIWTNNFINSDTGAILVYKENSVLLGYIIVSIGFNNKGKIELIGVSENYRGKGIGEKLINLSVKWFIDKKVEEISVVTQGSNISAMRLYSKTKFLPSEVNNWYHYWSVI